MYDSSHTKTDFVNWRYSIRGLLTGREVLDPFHVSTTSNLNLNVTTVIHVRHFFSTYSLPIYAYSLKKISKSKYFICITNI